MILKRIYVKHPRVTTTVEVMDENTLVIDGEEVFFPSDIVEFDPTEQIPEARRIDGILHVSIIMLSPYEAPGPRPEEDTNANYEG